MQYQYGKFDMIIRYYGKDIDIPNAKYTISFVTGIIVKWNIEHLSNNNHADELMRGDIKW